MSAPNFHVGQKFKDLGGHIVYIKTYDPPPDHMPDNPELDSWGLWSDTNTRDWANVFEGTAGLMRLIENKELTPMENTAPNKVAELLAALRHEVEKELAFCDEVATPNVCAMLAVQGGRTKIIDLICEYVGRNNMSISDAIIAIERERSTYLNELG